MNAPEQGPGDGGPVFPRAVWMGDSGRMEGGMTLRDWFAGQALEECIRLAQDRHGGWDEVSAAACAYSLADAMLRARKEAHDADD